MRTILLLPIALLLIAGCTGPGPQEAQPQQPSAPAANGTPAITCDQHCRSLPTPDCEGEWDISGTYPSCTCIFDCASEEANGSAAPAQPPAENTSAPEEPLAQPTDKSAEELLYEAMGKQRSDFYSENDGTFSERNYSWLRGTPGSGGISFDLAPASDVMFDNKEIRSIQAFGFTVFQDGPSEESHCAAVFNASSTALDSYTGSDAFSIDYFPSQADSRLRDCWVQSKDYNMDMSGGWLLTYYIKCERTLDK